MCKSATVPPQATFNNNSISRWDATPPPSRPSSPNRFFETTDAGCTTTIPMPQRAASWDDIGALVDGSIEIWEDEDASIDESSLPALKSCYQDSPLSEFFKTMSLSPMLVVTDNTKVHVTTATPSIKGTRLWSHQSNTTATRPSRVLQRSRRSTLLSQVSPTRSSLSKSRYISSKVETISTDTNEKQNNKWSLDDEDISSRMIQPPKRLPSKRNS